MAEFVIPTPATGSSITGLVKMEELLHLTSEDLMDLLESLRAQKKALIDKEKQICDALRISAEDNARDVLSREKPNATSPTDEDIISDNKISSEDNVTAVLSKEDSSVSSPTNEDIVIAFVDELEKVNQYFEFRDFLLEMQESKFDSDDPVASFRYLVQDLNVQKELKFNKLDDYPYIMVAFFRYLVQDLKVQKELKFNKLDYPYIIDAVDGFLVDLKKKKLFGEDSIRGNTRYKELSKEDCSWYSLMTPPEETIDPDELGPLLNPMVTLVYHIREKGHVMNKDPLVELEYIKKYDRVFYQRYFIRSLLSKYSEREVKVHHVLKTFNEDNVKELLKICGEVEYVQFKSLGQCRFAYVTFKDSESAKIAPLLMRWATSTCVSPVLEDYDYQPKDRTEYEKAMIKYNEFRRKYSTKSSN